MDISEFEETEYRGPLFNQLERGSHLLWEPGQVFEKRVGIDKALTCIHNYFWNLHQEIRPRPGVYLRRRNLDYLWTRNKKNKPLPDFSLNLFVQAKRSTYSPRSKRDLIAHGILRDHWFFDITPHQQKALEKLAANLKNKALVVYAAPVFHRQQHLYNHTTNQSIIENSTFPEVKKLKKHKRWYFDKPGVEGVANPKFERVTGKPLLAQIKDLRAQEGDFIANEQTDNLIDLANSINEFANDQSKLESDMSFNASRYAFYRNIIQAELDEYDISDMKDVKAYLEIETFISINKMDWLTF